MGRYYYTSTGREGKFMFGVQPSDDPEYMGMREDNQEIHYYADNNNKEAIEKKLDEQYELLGVPKKDRLYFYDERKEYDDYEDKVLKDKVWIKIKDDSEEAKAYKNKVGWYCEDKGYTYYERDNNAIILARIRLGTTILSDINENGYCSLDAEL